MSSGQTAPAQPPPAAPRPRTSVDALPAYRPGRSATTAMADHGIDHAVKLASNESPHGPLPSVAKAIEDAVADVNRYPDHRATALREAIGAHLGVEPARVAVGAGSVGLLQQLVLAYTTPGDELAYGWPSFEAYPVYSALTCATPAAVPLRRMTLDAGRMVQALRPRTRLVLVANPNNPTGTALRTDELLAIADALPEGCLLVVDEAYREFVRGADIPDALELLGDRPNVAVLRTFSKAYGLAALRVGYLVADPHVVDAVDKVLIPFAVNAVGQAAALASLEAVDELDDRVGAITAERQRMVDALRRRGWMVPDAEANFVWLPAGGAADALALELERRGVVTRPFDGYGIRVTVARPADTDLFVDAFDDAAEVVEAAGSWLLPVGAEARMAAAWIDRLDDVEARLAAHVEAQHEGLTDPDPGGSEQWDEGQVWAHLAEIGWYWLAELDLVLDDPHAGPVPFGRTKADPDRIAAIAAGRDLPPAEQFAVVRRAVDALRARLAELSTSDWTRVGRHSTLGDLTVADQLEHFHVGHYEEHADQLDTLVPR